MKITLFIGLMAATALTGCSELNHRQVTHYQDYGISDSLYAKMNHKQRLNENDIVELSQHEVRSSEIMTYLAYSNTEIPLTDDDARRLEREKVNGDVITYLRERPSHAGGFISLFRSSAIN